MARNTILSRNRLELCHGAKLRRKCNRKHNHTERAGRETKLIQTYTKWIVKIIMKGINQHIIDNFWQMCSRSLSGEVKDILKHPQTTNVKWFREPKKSRVPHCPFCRLHSPSYCGCLRRRVAAASCAPALASSCFPTSWRWSLWRPLLTQLVTLAGSWLRLLLELAETRASSTRDWWNWAWEFWNRTVTTPQHGYLPENLNYHHSEVGESNDRERGELSNAHVIEVWRTWDYPHYQIHGLALFDAQAWREIVGEHRRAGERVWIHQALEKLQLRWQQPTGSTGVLLTGYPQQLRRHVYITS